MPGLPVEGEDSDDSEPEIGEEDFDNMDLTAEDEPDEVGEEFGDDEPAADSAAAGAVSEAAGGRGSLDAVGKKTTIEDDDMTN
jgi:hypothetical protein